MPLQAGAILGGYEILAPLGAGGMGEVYRARDAKLGREVAIKVLPQEVAGHPDKLARFAREARLLAALNHPGIATLHGLEDADGTPFLVMELVEGETLAERLARGALPRDEALEVARQIAEALEAAHEKGIIHRDLKPANVKVDPDGRVKVLDFGLAKAFAEETPEADSSLSPTLSREATQAGVILGTASYMSPEQAKGRAVDKRSDVFSFGVVLFEMLAGKKAFPGDDVSEILASILKLEPDWSALPSDVTPGLRRLIGHCLRKDRGKRRQSIGDVRVEIEDLLAEPGGGASRAEGIGPPRAAVPRVAAVTAIATALVVGTGTWWLRSPGGEPEPVTRLSVTLPEQFAFRVQGSPRRGIAISRDGRRIVYTGRGPEGTSRLYLRSLDERTVRPIEGTAGAAQPFFSADGNWVGFFAEGGLRKIHVDGGNPVTLVDAVGNLGRAGRAIWREDGVIVFDNGPGGILSEVSAEGGAPVELTAATSGRSSTLQPGLEEATGHLLFSSHQTSNLVDPRIERIDGRSSERTLVLDGASLVGLTSSSHLLLLKDEAFMVAPYDATTHLPGAAVPFPEPVAWDSRAVTPQLAVAANGTLAFVPAPETMPAPVLGWITRGGDFSPLGSLPAGHQLRSVHLSPDGTTALLTTQAGRATHGFLYDLSRGVQNRLDIGEKFWNTRWHPDGRRIGVGGLSIRLRDLDTGAESTLAQGECISHRSPTWTADGTTLAYMGNCQGGTSVFSLMPGDEAPRVLIPGGHSPTISPNGLWIAYVHEEGVYVARLDDGGGRERVTRNHGWQPVWSRDGRELFFVEESRAVDGRLELRAVSVAAGETLKVGAAETLFAFEDEATSVSYGRGSTTSGAVYDVSLDGTRFLMARQPPPRPATEIVVVQNWHRELNRIAPVDP